MTGIRLVALTPATRRRGLWFNRHKDGFSLVAQAGAWWRLLFVGRVTNGRRLAFVDARDLPYPRLRPVAIHHARSGKAEW